jgi:hypothetical protein
MRRVGLFITTGPVLGFITILLLSIGVKPRFPALHASAVFVLFAFVASPLPSVISGLVDVCLKRKNWRIWGTTCAGTASGFSEMMYFHGSATALQMIEFCIFGAIPAAVCSWLSGEKQKEETM